MTPHEQIVAEIADLALARVVKRTMRGLQGLKDGLQSGADSGLANTWEEICAQVRTEESVLWKAYEATARALVLGELNRLSSQELSAMWLQTDPGEQWAQDEGEDAKPGYCRDDLEDHAFDALITEAASYSNRRIETYIYR
jgi:hypothetical protein